MRRKYVTFTEIVLNGLLLFSLLTVIQGVSYFEHINKVWMVAVVFVLIVRLVAYRYTISQLFVLFLTVIIHLFAIFLTEFPVDQINILFYFLLWVLIYLFFSKSKDDIMRVLQKSDFFIDLLLILWTIVVGISAFLPTSYKDKYFLSFTGGSFRLMPSVLIITALAMYMAISRKIAKYNLYLILPIFAGFMNQSRTYFGVFIIVLVMYFYMNLKNKKLFYIMLVPLGFLIIALMTASGIMDKITATQYGPNSYFDFWGTITSGRTVFWQWDLEAFFSLPVLQQFVGNGFNFVYDVNGANMARIWAHNDIINILMNFGYIGVVIYLWSYFQMVRAFWPKGNKIPIFVKCMFHGAVFLNSMMNMSYTYLCAMISYPLFLYVIAAKYEEKDKGNTDLLKN